jgi:hypothetical protein
MQVSRERTGRRLRLLVRLDIRFSVTAPQVEPFPSPTLRTDPSPPQYARGMKTSEPWTGQPYGLSTATDGTKPSRNLVRCCRIQLLSIVVIRALVVSK